MKNKSNFCNHHDHEEWSRRSFLKTLGFAGAGTLALSNSSLLFAQNSKLTNAIQNAESDRILLIIRLFGGNDGLNTVIMWGDGKMKIAHSVGYDDLSLSHFKGTQIWSSGRSDGIVEETGWMGRYFEGLHPDYNDNPPDVPTAIQIGTSKNTTFDGLDAKYSFSVSNVDRLEQITNSGIAFGLGRLPDCTHGDKLRFMRAITNSTYGYSDVIYEAFNRSTNFTDGGGYADNDFSQSLQIISRLIKGSLGSKVYMLTLDGFDTHSRQKGSHQDLLTTLSEAVDYFYKDLSDAGYGDKVLAMTVSEFGRRLQENDSNGTDHGTSSPILFFGEGLNGSGFVGDHASLKEEDLINGSFLNHHTDFRSAYASVLKEWLCVDSTVVDDLILRDEYETLDLGFSCATENIKPDNPNPNSFSSIVFIENLRSYIRLENITEQNIVIKLYAMSGQEIGTITNQVYPPGVYTIDIGNSINSTLATGAYIYKVSTETEEKSEVIPIQG